jgi:hypothetical protein
MKAVDMSRTGHSPIWIKKGCVNARQPVPSFIRHDVTEHECHAIQQAGHSHVLLSLRVVGRINLYCRHMRGYTRKSDRRESPASARFQDPPVPESFCHHSREALVDAHHESEVGRHIIPPELRAN